MDSFNTNFGKTCISISSDMNRINNIWSIKILTQYHFFTPLWLPPIIPFMHAGTALQLSYTHLYPPPHLLQSYYVTPSMRIQQPGYHTLTSLLLRTSFHHTILPHPCGSYTHLHTSAPLQTLLFDGLILHCSLVDNKDRVLCMVSFCGALQIWRNSHVVLGLCLFDVHPVMIIWP